MLTDPTTTPPLRPELADLWAWRSLWYSTRSHPQSDSRSCSTTCSALPSMRSHRLSTDPLARQNSWQAAPGAGCAAPRLRSTPPRRQREVVAAFLAAAQAGDFEALLEVLDPHVVFRVHTAPGDPRARPAAVGAKAVAGRVLAQGAPFAPLAEPALVNGGAGLMVRRAGRLLGVMGCTVSEGRITSMDLVIDPDRLPKPG